MANHKSALKRHRQSEKRRVRNSSIKSALRTSIKQIRESVAKGDKEEAAKRLSVTTSNLDKAVTKGVLHRNSASRRISRLTTAVNAISK